jgi:hypothetical protein
MYYTHDQHTAKALGIVAAICLLALALTGCAKSVTVQQERQPTLAETLGNMGKTSKAVACVFAPWHDECQRLKSEKVPHQTQEEYLEEVSKDFDDLDKEIEKSKSE